MKIAPLTAPDQIECRLSRVDDTLDGIYQDLRSMDARITRLERLFARAL
jgi:hypothetical protein